jgi:glycine oxidase
MHEEPLDFFVLGQGLAGTTAVWEIQRRGRTFHAFDSPNASSASSIAAGLVTPLTGKRIQTNWNWDQAMEAADSHYQFCEKAADASFWYREPSIRFLTLAEVSKLQITDQWTSLIAIDSADLEINTKMRKTLRSKDVSHALIMKNAARLDCKRYLEASQQYFRQANSLTANLPSLSGSFSKDREGNWQYGELRAKRILFCRGAIELLDEDSPFAAIDLVPARGDILSVAIESMTIKQVLHYQGWIAPRSGRERGNRDQGNNGNDQDMRQQPSALKPYAFGSNYRWDWQDPSNDAKEQIKLLEKARSWLGDDVTMIEGQSGTRPASFDHLPMLGLSASDTSLGIINGLGAKGTLYAPLCAKILLDAWLDQKPIPDVLKWDRSRKQKSI